MDVDLIVGLEIHAQLRSDVKLFSETRLGDDFVGARANSLVSPMDLALPGALPRLNLAPVMLAIRVASALGLKIQPCSSFDRKHYFYHDNPAGYQITQHYHPLATDGRIYLAHDEGEGERLGSRDVIVRIKHLQIEQDTAKTQVEDGRVAVDYNRAGVALVEIVTEPDLQSSDQVERLIKKLRKVLKSTRACQGNMEDGSLRVDVNINIRWRGEKSVRVEIKNLNSIKSVKRAIEWEGKRHYDALQAGLAIRAETRSFDPVRGETVSMRAKESMPEYRYMPDPDLPPLAISPEFVQESCRGSGVRPEHRRARILGLYGPHGKWAGTEDSLRVREYQILEGLYDGLDLPDPFGSADGVDTVNVNPFDYFEVLVKLSSRPSPRSAAGFMTNDLLGLAKKLGMDWSGLARILPVEESVEVLNALERGVPPAAGRRMLVQLAEEQDREKRREILREVAGSAGTDPDTSDAPLALCSVISTCLEEHPRQLEKARGNLQGMVGFFTGQVVKQLGGPQGGGGDGAMVRREVERVLREWLRE